MAMKPGVRSMRGSEFTVSVHSSRARAVVQRNCCVRSICQVPSAPSPPKVETMQKLDVVALSNLCVDIVLPVPSLPVPSYELLEQLTCDPPPRSSWEVGGSANFMIAAARLGLKTAAVGHYGRDVYGNFLQEVLKDEQIVATEQLAPPQLLMQNPSLERTLCCFVLIDPQNRHRFCSKYDFGPWPLLEGITTLPGPARQMLQNTRAVFTNGFVFDELPADVVTDSLNTAICAGASVFFDPGPRCHTMKQGARKEAMETVLSLSHVALMTEDEALVVTGLTDPEAAAREVLQRSGTNTQWAVVKLGGKGALLCTRDSPRTYFMDGVKVEVLDTVGCGDSFASAVVLGFINGCDIHSTLMLANAVGAATATGRGAGRNVASPSQVMQLLMRSRNEGVHANAPHVVAALDMLHSSLTSVDVMD